MLTMLWGAGVEKEKEKVPEPDCVAADGAADGAAAGAVGANIKGAAPVGTAADWIVDRSVCFWGDGFLRRLLLFLGLGFAFPFALTCALALALAAALASASAVGFLVP